METVLENKKEINDPDLSFGSTLEDNFSKVVWISIIGRIYDKVFLSRSIFHFWLFGEKDCCWYDSGSKSIDCALHLHKLLSELYNDFVPTLDKGEELNSLMRLTLINLSLGKIKRWSIIHVHRSNVGDIFYYKGKINMCFNIQEIVNSMRVKEVFMIKNWSKK